MDSHGSGVNMLHKYKILIFFTALLLSSCASIDRTPILVEHRYKDWCQTCANKGFIECDNCWHGKMLDDTNVGNVKG